MVCCFQAMPTLPRWYLRVPEMLARLRTPGAPPFLDRPAIEALFQVRRRQAIRLLGTAQGYQVGKTFLVDREALIAYLDAFEHSGAAPQARERRWRVAATLNEASQHLAAQSIQVPTARDVLRRRASQLPEAIEITGPGRLQISFTSAEDLLAKVAELAAAATNDYPSFRQYVEERG